MPSGYLTSLPDNVVLDEGVLYNNSSTAFGVSKGPLSYDPGEEWQNLDFAGKRAPVAELDRVIGRAPKISGTIIAISTSIDDVLFPGATIGTVGAVTTITPKSASALLATASYATNTRAVWKQGDGNFFLVKFAMAKWHVTAIRGVDKDTAEIDIEIEARLDLSASTDTDASPVVYQLTNTLA